MMNRLEIQCQQKKKEKKLKKSFDIGENKLKRVNVLYLKRFEIFTEKKYMLKDLCHKQKSYTLLDKPTKQQH